MEVASHACGLEEILFSEVSIRSIAGYALPCPAFPYSSSALCFRKHLSTRLFGSRVSRLEWKLVIHHFGFHRLIHKSN